MCRTSITEAVKKGGVTSYLFSRVRLIYCIMAKGRGPNPSVKRRLQNTNSKEASTHEGRTLWTRGLDRLSGAYGVKNSKEASTHEGRTLWTGGLDRLSGAYGVKVIDVTWEQKCALLENANQCQCLLEQF
ncbi:hypothetical protein V5799_013427 [Amblyomma americanum]|uniref:Uncharacterized protein n=1 Tax=Amblyomma americanum TaxID=6943 RepID=A0AAQ4E5Z3_AMBAM